MMKRRIKKVMSKFALN